MTMDPELAEIVRLAGAAPVLPLDRNAVGAFRELSRAGMLAYGEGPELAKVEDQTVPGPRGRVPVRVYHPDGEPVADPELRIRCQMLVYPVTDIANRAASYSENGEGYLLTAAAMEFFIDCYAPERSQRLDPRASPLLDTSFVGLPKTLVITAELDPLRDEGEAYARVVVTRGHSSPGASPSSRIFR